MKSNKSKIIFFNIDVILAPINQDGDSITIQK